MTRLIAAVLSGLLATTTLASAFPGSTIRYQGSVVITSVTQTCTDQVGVSVGDRSVMSYRLKVASSDPADAIEIAGVPSFFHAVATQASGSLNGSTGTTTAGINNGLTVFHDVAASANLSIVSFTGGSIASANNIRINGTLTDFFFTPGCTVGIRAALTLDPAGG